MNYADADADAFSANPGGCREGKQHDDRFPDTD